MMLEEPQPREALMWSWAAAQGLRVWVLESDLGGPSHCFPSLWPYTSLQSFQVPFPSSEKGG